jgi:predicted nucleic-acid-binding protein
MDNNDEPTKRETRIRVSIKTIQMLKRLKISSRETYEEVINRLIRKRRDIHL